MSAELLIANLFRVAKEDLDGVGRIKNPPTQQEFDAAADRVEAVLSDAATRLGVDLSAANTPAAKPGPVR